MVVGVAKVELYFLYPNSLKEKRQVLRALVQKLEANFKRISLAEVDGHDLWQRATIAICLVGKDKQFVDSKLTSIIEFVKQNSELEIIKADIDLIGY